MVEVQAETCLSVLEVWAEVEIGIIVEMDQAIGIEGDVLEIELVILVAVPPPGLVQFAISFHQFV